MCNAPTGPQATAAGQAALAIYRATLDAVRADGLVRRRVALTGSRLTAADAELDLDDFDHIRVVGAGKAAAPMAAAIEQILGDRLAEGLVVTKDGHALPTRHIEVIEAAHPVPDERSIEAGRRIVEMVGRSGPTDLVICLLSGGASALMELPEEAISLADLQLTTSLLLKAGAPIEDLNAVRACLSRIKAGGLARAAGEATLLCLALSDVLGNPLSVIGSGPCLETVRDRTRAIGILRARGVLESIPDAVLALLRTAADEPGWSASGTVTHVILGDIWTALEAAREAAEAEGLKPVVLTGWLEGEAREVGRVFGTLARDLPRVQEESGIDCYIAGGETTVTVRGSGKGGRSQELACSAATAMGGVEDVALLAAGTDGTDGPTDAAGGIVNGATAHQAEAAGCDFHEALRDNDTYPALAAVGSLLITGPTNSNVGDIVVIVKRET